VSDRLFHRSVASVTVGALGPNAEHFLHATNFGRRSLLIQRSEPPQNGHGRSARREKGDSEGEIGIRFSSLSYHINMAWVPSGRRYINPHRQSSAQDPTADMFGEGSALSASSGSAGWIKPTSKRNVRSCNARLQAMILLAGRTRA
jgi:hypothetical protein